MSVCFYLSSHISSPLFWFFFSDMRCFIITLAQFQRIKKFHKDPLQKWKNEREKEIKKKVKDERKGKGRDMRKRSEKKKELQIKTETVKRAQRICSVQAKPNI